jgi:5-methylcytosine-specific restriction endonuclease McrA
VPSAMLKPCGWLGGTCPELVERGCCPAHRKDTARAQNLARGATVAQLGYGSRWTAYSRRFRERYPLCGMRPDGTPETRDSLCTLGGRVSASQMTDHIVPVSGPKDPLFWDRRNHQALCNACHAVKRQRESRQGRGGRP